MIQPMTVTNYDMFTTKGNWMVDRIVEAGRKLRMSDTDEQVWAWTQLSPENLHCDGEASLTHVRAKAKQLNLVSKQLEQYCLDNWLDTPVLEY